MAPAGPLPAPEYIPPPGPPPSHNTAPPAYSHDGPADFAPPPGPPPGHHDWQTAVPDTTLFPPPPALFDTWERSPANNATEQEADAGADWCAQHPLQQGFVLDRSQEALLAAHDLGLVPPSSRFRGDLQRLQPGLWGVRTKKGSADACLQSHPPLYVVQLHSPLRTGRPCTAYYEVYVRPDYSGAEVGLALGLAALPYPGFRLPGWHRGSLAVHGDDGHRYVNDATGGLSFTEPFRPGETYGLGIQFSAAAPGQGRALDVEVLFTRNGRLDGRWDLYEEVDANDQRPLEGLEGFHDLSVAIGTFEAVGFEVRLDPKLWMYRFV